MLLTIIITLFIGSYTGHIDKRIFRQGDFMAFYTAGIIVKESHDLTSINLYDIEKQWTIQNEHGLIEPNEMPTAFLNPPIYAWLMVPLSKMPYVFALNIWRLISVLIALFSVIILTKGLRLDLNWWDTFTILMASMPGVAVLINGQNTFLFLGLYVVSFALLAKGHDFSAGIFLGFGVLKPQLFLFLPVVLFFQKKWNVLVGFILGFLLITSASIFLIGLEGIVEFINIFTTNMYLEGIQVQAHKMHSFPAFIRLIIDLEINPIYLALYTYSVLAAVIGYLSLKKGLKFEAPELLSLSILGTLIAAPHLFHYDLALLLMPFLLIYYSTKNDKQSYIMSRNSRLVLVTLFAYLWLVFFIIEILRVQFSSLLIICLFVIVLNKSALSRKGYKL